MCIVEMELPARLMLSLRKLLFLTMMYAGEHHIPSLMQEQGLQKTQTRSLQFN